MQLESAVRDNCVSGWRFLQPRVVLAYGDGARLVAYLMSLQMLPVPVYIQGYWYQQRWVGCFVGGSFLRTQLRTPLREVQ